MLRVTRTSSDNPDFLRLVQLLDQDLQVRNGEDHAFYAQFNKVDNIKHVVVAYHHDRPVGCGAFKEFSPGLVEIKRMYVRPESRGQGVAQTVLAELEQWAGELHCAGFVLETGQQNPEAIRLYQKSGYRLRANYGPYVGKENSVCMRKEAPALRGNE